MYHVIHHGIHHAFDNYERWEGRDWCTYEVPGKGKFGVSIGLIGQSFEEAAGLWIESEANQIQQRLEQANGRNENLLQFARSYLKPKQEAAA